jgi:hypothetical protein
LPENKNRDSINLVTLIQRLKEHVVHSYPGKKITSIERNFGKAALLVFFFGVLLRATLACINWDANDDHISVIRVIADENRIPVKVKIWTGRKDLVPVQTFTDEMDQAFQPKLYHVVVAALWKTMQIQSLPLRIRIAQLVNCSAGILTLLVALYFLMEQSRVSAKSRFIAFSLLALNPQVIGINAQATNDSFVILFVSLSLFFGYRFFESRVVKDFSWMTTFAILAGLSKGNGLVVCIAILLVFTLALLQGWNGCLMIRGQVVSYGTIFLTAYLAVVPMLGSYWEHYHRYGSPFTINMHPGPFPYVLEKTFVYRPGVTSIVDSLLTFRLLDMLQTPVIPNDRNIYPQHRTSLWSQLYGRTHFVHFNTWPPSWQLPEGRWQWATRLVWNLGRVIFLFALLPTMLLLVAILRTFVSAIRWVIKAQEPPVPYGQWLLDFSVLGYIAFIVAYSLRYRDFSVMKAIFVFPALLGFLILFARECDRFYAWCHHKKPIRFSADMIFAFLCLLYTADVIVLIGQLSLIILSYRGYVPQVLLT